MSTEAAPASHDFVSIGPFVATVAVVLIAVINWLVAYRRDRRSKCLRLIARALYCDGLVSDEPPVESGNGITIINLNRELRFDPGQMFDKVPCQGAMVRLVVENHGRRAMNASVVQPADIGIDAPLGQISEGARLRICYPFDKQQLCKRLRFRLSFESEGMRQIYTYETIHGKCCLTRVDPT